MVHGIVVHPHWNNVLFAQCACGWQAYKPNNELQVEMNKHLTSNLKNMIEYARGAQLDHTVV